MAETTKGGLKTKAANLARDPDHYRKIGAMGGAALTGKKGFAIMPKEQVAAFGSKGGKRSKRGPHPENCPCRIHIPIKDRYRYDIQT